MVMNMYIQMKTAALFHLSTTEYTGTRWSASITQHMIFARLKIHSTLAPMLMLWSSHMRTKIQELHTIHIGMHTLSVYSMQTFGILDLLRSHQIPRRWIFCGSDGSGMTWPIRLVGKHCAYIAWAFLIMKILVHLDFWTLQLSFVEYILYLPLHMVELLSSYLLQLPDNLLRMTRIGSITISACKQFIIWAFLFTDQ